MANDIINGDIYEDDIGYKTCDLYLAAFFLSSGCKMIDSVREQRSKRVYFIFEKNHMMQELKVNYFSRKAKVDALSFADNIKSLKSLCHNVLSGVA